MSDENKPIFPMSEISLKAFKNEIEKELILEFLEKLRKYLGCETCTSAVKPKTCKSCCDLYPIIEEYEAILK